MSFLNSKVKKMTDGISASLNTPIPDAYYEALATQYGVTFEQAKAIAGTAQLDMANNIKKTLSNINVADEIINLVFPSNVTDEISNFL